MSPEYLAFLSAFCFAAAFIAGKRGLAGSSLMGAILVTLATATVVTTGAWLLDPPLSVSTRGVALFVIAGLIAPGIGYSAALTGVHLLGPSIAVPIQQGGRPLIAVTMAAVFLGESIDLVQSVGIAAIIVGGVGLSRREAIDVPDIRSEPRVERRHFSDFVRPGIMFPVMAAVALGAFDVMGKHSLSVTKAPTFGAAVTVASGFFGWALLAILVPKIRRAIALGPNIGWIVLGGVFLAVAVLSIFHALLDGRVGLVSPILASQPLIVLLLSHVVLREIESVSVMTAALAMLVVAGTILVVL